MNTNSPYQVSESSAHQAASLYFRKKGLPHRKTPGYRHTPINKFIPTSDDRDARGKTLIEIERIKELAKYAIVFRGGEFSEELSSLPKGLTISKTTDFPCSLLNSFQALALTNTKTYYQLTLEPNISLENIVLIQDGLSWEKEKVGHQALTVKIGAGSSMTLFDYSESESKENTLQNIFTQFDLEENAVLNYTAANFNQNKSHQIYQRTFNLAKAATLNSIFYTGGNGLSRNDLTVNLQGQEAHADLAGFYALKGEQFADYHLDIVHQAPYSTSKQLFKGILKERSRAVFTGRVLVEAKAIQVDSAQLNKNLILESTAQVYTEPQLEVYTDDVKCAHGATIGQLSDDEIFYLESRGIPKEQAYQILCKAYAQEVIQKIKSEKVQAFINEKLYQHFDFSSMAHQLSHSEPEKIKE